MTALITWTPNPVEQQITNYSVFEHVGTAFNVLGSPTAPSFTTSVLSPGLHAFVVAAVNAAGLSSPNSAEVTVTVPLPLPLPTAPVGLKIVFS